jgi:hypothetical protein
VAKELARVVHPLLGFPKPFAPSLFPVILVKKNFSVSNFISF